MNAEQINAMTHPQIIIWLGRALNGQEPLPRLTPDESRYLGILRLDKSLDSAARKSLRDGTLGLLRQFCDHGSGEVSYVQELLSLASAFKQPETPGILADLACRFPELPTTLHLAVRYAVLGALVDGSSPHPPAFWKEILEQEPEKYALLALSGVLATDPLIEGVSLLPKMPDSKRAGQAAAIKLDLVWDALPVQSRFRFVEQIQNVLGQCGQNFAGPVRLWSEKKQPIRVNKTASILLSALKNSLGEEFQPRYRTSKLLAA